MTKYSKDYRFIRPLVMFAFDFECVFCNKKSLDLEVHHIDGNNLNNDLFNLVPVHKHCHMIIHKCVYNYSHVHSESQLLRLKDIGYSMCFNLR
jgi:hypothetical protein